MRTLETERMILRDWDLADLSDFLEMHNKNEGESQLRYLINAKNNYALVLKDSNKVIGSVGLNEDADNNPNGRNLGYILNKLYWDRGYMQEALREIIKNASEVTSFLSAAFSISNYNEKSLHIINKLGFKLVKTINSGTNETTGEPCEGFHYYVLELS